MQNRFNSSRSIVHFLAPLGLHTSLIIRCSICQDLGRLTHIPSQGKIAVSIGVEGYIGAQAVQSSESQFHLQCCYAANRLGQYPNEVTQEHKHGSNASEPVQYPDIVTCITSLCRKPFSYFTLFIFIFLKIFTFSFFSFSFSFS